MSIFRIHPSKSNTIASGVAYENYNAGFNPISNLWFGGGAESIISVGTNNSISRYLIYFDLSELQNKFLDKTIMSGNVTSYKLKIKNCLPSDKLLKPRPDDINKLVATSFDLMTFAINMPWDEGDGYDLVKNIYAEKSNGLVHITGVSNWNSATRLSTWTEPGVFENPSASTAFYTTQHFDVGNEDLEMDITTIVNSWISGGTQNNGLGVCYTRPYELMSSDTRYISAFFTEKTNTAYLPFIEVNYDQTIEDDRLQFSNQKINRLFLFTYSDNQPLNYFSAGTVDIKDADDTVVATYTPTQIQKGVYYIDVYLPNSTPGDIYSDNWNDVTFNPGYDQQTFTQYFAVKPNFYSNNSKGVNQYSLKTYGIENNSIINYSGITRVYVETTTNFTNNNAYVPYGLQYQLILNNKDEIITWTNANYTTIDNYLTYFFDIDTTWLLSNQTYNINFKINELGTQKVVEENIRFRVLFP